MSFIDSLISEGIVFSQNEPMNVHTSFHTGGCADVFIRPAGVDMLSKALKVCSDCGVKPFILGNGTNILVPDSGLRRPVIHIGEGFAGISVDGCIVHCGAGTSLKKLCKTAYDNALTGLEFANGIPGCAGGAAYMNAGAYGGEMKDVLISCSHIDFNGNAGSFCTAQLAMSHRRSVYTDSDYIITDISVGLRNGSKTDIKEKMDDLMGRRRDKQPLEYPSAGSVFKRPEGYFAGALIEQCGLKGKSVGGAQVSEKHAGFIVNKGGATTKDVTDLIDFCRETVYKNTGVLLEPEIKIIQDI